MPDQVLRFAVGRPLGPRSQTWRLWVPKGKSDVYVSGRTLGSSVKVSLHEPGPARFALTKTWVQRSGFQAPPDRDSRLAVEWNRPRPTPSRIARPLAVLVPYSEVLPRGRAAGDEVVWCAPPPEGHGIHFDVIYVSPGVDTSIHPGARSMSTSLVGRVELANGQTVFVTSVARPIQPSLAEQLEKLKGARVINKVTGEVVFGGTLAFGTEPNQDSEDGTSIGVLTDVTGVRAQPA